MRPTGTYEGVVVLPRAGVAGWLDRLARVPLSIHQLLFRLGVASVFARAGMTKASSWESTIALFRDEYRVPVFPPASRPRSRPRSSLAAPRCSSSGSAPAWPPFRCSR